MHCATVMGVGSSPRPSCECFRTAQKNITGAPPSGYWTRARGRPGKVLRVHLFDAAALHHAVESSSYALQHLSHSMLMLADLESATKAVVQSAADTVAPVVQATGAVGDSAAQSVAAASSSGGGGAFGWLADLFENFLQVLDSGFEKLGVPYSYGFAIIALTVLVKLATFPLTQKQVESTLSLQALQPRVKELQAKYADNPEQLQLETARLYKEAGVNPLAGCLPTLATIPVFIGLYRALTQAADQGLLTDGFFFIPSLGGPTSIMARQSGAGLSWLFPLKDGAPPVGWHDAIAYLTLPVLLVVSQYISQKVISSTSNQDPSQQQAQAILKFLPLMIGWFSLNVPSGLSLYWLVNNILSTGQQVYLKSQVRPALATASSSASTAPVVDTSIVDDPPKRPSGRELGSRKKKRSAGETVVAEVIDPSKPQKGEKFRALKAREAASRAATIANVGSSDSPSRGERFAALREQETKSVATVDPEPELKVPEAAPAKDNSSN